MSFQDPLQVTSAEDARALKKVATIRLGLINALKRVFHPNENNRDGQEILKYLMDRSFFFEPTFNTDERKMYMNEGKREMFLEIMKMMHKDTREIEIHIRELSTQFDYDE